MVTNKGFLITAFGHPHYAKMAVNLAVSIRCLDSEIPIKVCCDKYSRSGIEQFQTKFFTEIKIEGDGIYTYNKGRHWGLMKTRVNQLSDYDFTFYIDTDSLFLPGKNIESVFEKVSKYPFACETRGTLKISNETRNIKIGDWSRIYTILDKFNFKIDTLPFYTQTSFMSFDNSEMSKSIFTNAEEVTKYFLKNGNYDKWYDSVPDELSFATAFAMSGYIPENSLNICHFNTVPSMPNKAHIMKDFDFVTFPSAGGDIRQTYKDFYNALAATNAFKLRLVSAATEWKNKRQLARPNHFIIRSDKR